MSALIVPNETNIHFDQIHWPRPHLSFISSLDILAPRKWEFSTPLFLFPSFHGDDLLADDSQWHPGTRGWPWYVLAAALGSTIGVVTLWLVAHKLGEEGIKKMAGGGYSPDCIR